MDARPAAPDTIRALHRPRPAHEPRSGTAAENLYPVPWLAERGLRPLRPDRQPRPPLAPLPIGQQPPALHNKPSQPPAIAPPGREYDPASCRVTCYEVRIGSLFQQLVVIGQPPLGEVGGHHLL